MTYADVIALGGWSPRVRTRLLMRRSPRSQTVGSSAFFPLVEKSLNPFTPCELASPNLEKVCDLEA